MGTTIVNISKIYPEYGSYYYALFFNHFEDIKYEIVCIKFTKSPVDGCNISPKLNFRRK
jgi:hypothetical protein